MGLILELQRDAMDGKVPVSQVVRRAHVAARKLAVTDIGKWLENEHRGYPEEESLPGYRNVDVHSYRIWYYYHGWQPIEFPPELRQLFASRPIAGSVAWIEEAIKNPEIYAKVNEEIVDILNQDNPNAINYYSLQGRISHDSFTNILEVVRNTILDWTLDLESQGVLGDDLSFSPKDKEVAKAVSDGFNIGNVTNSQVLINSPYSSQKMQLDSTSIEALRDLVSTLRRAIEDANELNESAHNELAAEIATLEAQANSPKPKRAVIIEALTSTRSILENAAGGALGAASVPAISSLLQNLSS